VRDKFELLPFFSSSSIFELILSAVAFLVLLIYHLHLIYKVRHTPLSTAIGLTNHVRRKWVQSVMKEQGDIVAVQTLRNQVMAANFLASTAILIALGLMGGAFRPEFYSSISHALNLVGVHSETLWMFKLMLLVVLFFYAFFNFTLAIRYYNHAGFMIEITDVNDPNVTPEAVSEVLNHGALHYTMGMRGFYLAVPSALWLFGPVWLLSGAIVMIWVLYRLDRTA
jgi:uncharacterized membrane protein